MNTKLLRPRNVWRWLTKLPPGLHEPELQRRSRLLLSILVVLLALTLVFLAFQALQFAAVTDPAQKYMAGVVFPLVLGAALVCLLTAYVLGRTGHTTLSAATLVAIATVASWAMVFVPGSSGALHFPVVGVILASIVLSRRQMLVIFALTVLATLALPLLVHEVSYWSVSGTLIFLLSVGMLSLVSALVHERDLGQIEGQTRTLIANQEKIIGARKTEAIARLSAGIAHEFNNIAMAIVGYADVIASQPAESAGRYAELIKGAGLRAGRLTEQLLSFSRQQLLNSRATDLNQLVAGLEHLLRSMLNERIRLALHLDPGETVAHVDPDLIGQVLQTLLRRAGENVCEGGDVVVRTAIVAARAGTAPSSSRPERYCAVTISDTGPPLDKEVLARIFDPFFKEGEFGTGKLDLAAAFGIVAQSGGRIEVTSGPGRGNTFVVMLPEEAGPS